MKHNFTKHDRRKIALSRRLISKTFLVAWTITVLGWHADAGRVSTTEPRTAFTNSVRAVDPAMFTPAPLNQGDLDKKLDLMIALRMRDTPELLSRVAKGEIIAPDEMAARYYPLNSDYQAVASWLRGQGLDITMSDSPSNIGIFASGTVSQVSRALQVSFAKVSLEGTEYTSAITPPSLPSTLSPAVLGINGLQPHVHPHKHSGPLRPLFNNRPPYTVLEILRAYNGIGLNASGLGQKIGIVIDTFPFSGDLTSFWQQCGVNQSLANIEHVQVVDGTLPSPSGEESLDVEWSSSMAPSAKVRIYATIDLFSNHLDRAYQQILNDLPNQPGLRQISLSYGLGETYYGSSSQVQTDAQYFLSMVSAGVTVFVSSGDGGSTPGSGAGPGGAYGDTSGPLQVEYPASDVSVTGVGGTSLYLDASSGSVTREIAWSLGGGGSSILFTRPSWQSGTGVPSGNGRLVPDVALPADADNTPCLLVLNGVNYPNGGTSWSSPTWAGFCALLNQSRANAGLQPLGLLGPKIYPFIGSANFRDITSGSNGFTAGSGYDRCTGVGVPNLATLLQSLTAGGSSGKPNLTPYRPTGWTDKIVVSNVTGTNSDSSPLQSTDNLYVDWAQLNNGDAATSATFQTELYIDGVFAGSWHTDPPFGANSYNFVPDFSIGRLSAGTHTIRLKVDSTNTVIESNETDNEYTKTITVGTASQPDLTLSAPAGWSDKIVVSNVTGTHADSPTLASSDTLYLDFAILNNGSAPAVTLFYTEVYVDNVLKVTFHTNPPLDPNSYTVALDYSLGMLPAGSHSIRVKVDSTDVIAESNEGNNEFTKTIFIGNPSLPNLRPYQPSGWSDKIVVSNVSGTKTDSALLTATDTLYIDWAVLNNGAGNITADFLTQLYVDDVLRASWTSPPPTLANYYRYVQDYNLGSLAPGSHTVRIKADSANVIAESDESDNEYTKTITITAPTPTVATPIISPNGGNYSGSVQISLSCATSGATIYYTTNGSDPAAGANVYSQPFTLTSSATVKAKAVESGFIDSQVASSTFAIANAPPSIPIPNGAVIGLVANANGLYVSTQSGNLSATQSTIGISEQFKILDQGNGFIALQSVANNRFVTAAQNGNQPLVASATSIGDSEQFRPADQGNGKFVLIAKVNGKYVCADIFISGSAPPLIANRTAVGGWEQFQMVFMPAVKPVNVIFALISSSTGKYVTADFYLSDAHPPLVADRPALLGWERFQMLDTGRGTINVRSFTNGRFISADMFVSGTEPPLIADRVPALGWEEFELLDAGEGYVALRAMANGKYVSATGPGGRLLANQFYVGPSERFTLNVALQSQATGLFVSANSAGQLVPDHSQIGDSEQFQIVNIGNGYVAMKARANGKYVSADALVSNSAPPLIANRTIANGWEWFQWIAGGNGTIALKSGTNGMFVSADNGAAGPLTATRTSADIPAQFR